MQYNDDFVQFKCIIIQIILKASIIESGKHLQYNLSTHTVSEFYKLFISFSEYVHGSFYTFDSKTFFFDTNTSIYYLICVPFSVKNLGS